MTGLIDKRLSVLAWAKGFSLWNYWTLDHTEATERGFFNEAREFLAHAQEQGWDGGIDATLAGWRAL